MPEGKLIADGNGQFATLQLSIEQFILLDEVDDELLDEHVLVLIIGPAITLNTIVLKGFSERRR